MPPRPASALPIALLLAALACVALAQGDGTACSAAYDGIAVTESVVDGPLGGVVQLGPNGDVRILASFSSADAHLFWLSPLVFVTPCPPSEKFRVPPARRPLRLKADIIVLSAVHRAD